MIWGTVLTTLFSNLLVPGVYVFRVLEVRLRTFLSRTLSAPLAGAAALVASTWLLRMALPPDPLGHDALGADRSCCSATWRSAASPTWRATWPSRPAAATWPPSSAGSGAGSRRRPRPKAATPPFRSAGEGLD